MSNTQEFSPFVKGTPTAIKYEITIEGPLEAVVDFIDEIDTIKSATAEDTVIITVNSGGGDPLVSAAIIDAITECPAYIIMKAVGLVGSAATAIFLNGEASEYYCDKDAEFLFHQTTYGLGRISHSHLQDCSKFFDKASDRWYDRYYKGVLPDELIEEITKGLECYMFGDEVMEMLAKSEKFNPEKETTDDSLEGAVIDVLDVMSAGLTYEEVMKLKKGELQDLCLELLGLTEEVDNAEEVE